MLRNPAYYIDKSKKALWEKAKELKTRGIISKLGITIYDPNELDGELDSGDGQYGFPDILKEFDVTDDINADGIINILDVILLVNVILGS